MESYRKDLGALIVLCENPKCGTFNVIDESSEHLVKVGRLITCRECRCISVITKELESYVKQTRCHS